MKNIVVIGGSSGIGLALVKLLCDEGHQVYATYRETSPEFSHAHLNYQHLDVLDDELRLDVPDVINGLVYCPGSINLKPFNRIKPEAFIDDFNLQVVGAVKAIQMILPNLKASQSSSIVLFSTVAVQKGFNFHSQVATSKGAIEGLTRALAAELAPVVRVNCLAPSLTDTPLAGKLLNTDDKKNANAQRHPMKRIGKSTDIAQAASFLLSEKAGWVTGQILHIDGGISSINN